VTERQGSHQKARVELTSCLRARWPEIESAAMTRLHGVSDAPGFPGPDYTDGLGAAAAAALKYLLIGVEHGGNPPQPPPAVLVQARLAVRYGVSFDTVLRRCFAGYTLFGDFVIQEAEDCALLEGTAIKAVLRTQAAFFDRLVTAVAEEYTRETGRHSDSTDQRRFELVQGLLAGELLDASELGYDFDLEHLGLIAAGPAAAEAIRDLASALDCRLLLVSDEGEAAWAWLGARRGLDLDRLESLLRPQWPDRVSLAIGEQASGAVGWRLTHRQAKAALAIAIRSPEPVHYADVALLSTALHNEVLVASLHQLYLDPLDRERNDGQTLRQTLHAYLAAGNTVSSAAISLGVKRHTVTNRLRTIEERIGRPLDRCTAELALALRIEDLGGPLRAAQPSLEP
jgi:hypothetical protein